MGKRKGWKESFLNLTDIFFMTCHNNLLNLAPGKLKNKQPKPSGVSCASSRWTSRQWGILSTSSGSSVSRSIICTVSSSWWPGLFLRQSPHPAEKTHLVASSCDLVLSPKACDCRSLLNQDSSSSFEQDHDAPQEAGPLPRPRGGTPSFSETRIWRHRSSSRPHHRRLWTAAVKAVDYVLMKTIIYRKQTRC